MTLDAEHPAAAPDPSDHGGHPDTPPAGEDPERSGADPATEAPAATQSVRRRVGGSAGLLGAAMLAVGEILEPEKTSVEIVQTDDEPLDDLPFGIDFGDLPPLD